MKIQKRFNVAAAPDRIWNFITDPEKLAPCMPGCKDVELLAPGRYRAVIAIQVGPIKATISGIAEMREERPPDYAEYVIQAEEGGNSSRISAVSNLTIRQLADDECEVAFIADVNINGRLGKFGAGVMQKIADNLGDKFANAMCSALQQGKASSEHAEPTVEITPEAGGILGLLRRLLRVILGRR